jgi:hypothetical protein
LGLNLCSRKGDVLWSETCKGVKIPSDKIRLNIRKPRIQEDVRNLIHWHYDGKVGLRFVKYLEIIDLGIRKVGELSVTTPDRCNTGGGAPTPVG